MSDAAIRIRNVNKRFGATHAVRDLDLEVPPGSLCGFLGPNGAGKSTTIRMIMSIIYPDSGAIEVLGGSALASKDRIGYLPEERGLYRKMRVGEFLEYIARLKGAGRRGEGRTIQQWLESVELPEVARKRCQELSKGMQQKIQFLAAIIHEPDLLILDEPFSGLDPVNAELINRLIGELRRAGKTIILSTHVLHQAEQICDRIFLINHGVKLLDASLAEIRRAFDPRTIVAEPTNGTLQVEGIDGVVNVRPIGHDGAVEIMIEEGADPHPIMQTVLGRQPMRRIELRRPTLEDVFVQLVMEDEGAAAAAKAREELGHV
ncbi:MAG: ATP-binding cassette domain-containing protein [Planctomycetota bacterium]|nr:ATP-binding cassette domain-containing protein [Planctomycetota bacterium]